MEHTISFDLNTLPTHTQLVFKAELIFHVSISEKSYFEEDRIIFRFK